MRRAIAQDTVLLSAYLFFVIVIVRGDSSPWIAAVGVVAVILQALRLAKRLVQLRQERVSTSR